MIKSSEARLVCTQCQKEYPVEQRSSFGLRGRPDVSTGTIISDSIHAGLVRKIHEIMTFNKELSNSLSLISPAERDLNFSGGGISRLLSFSGGLLTCSMTLESSRKEKGLIQSIITPKHPIKIFPMPLSVKAQSDLHLSL